MSPDTELTTEQLMAIAGPPSGAPTQAPARQSAARQPVRFADDRDALARTILGEAANQGENGMLAVGGVIVNRARARGLTPSQVVLEPNQFEPWGNPETTQRLLSVSPNDPNYQRAYQIAGRALAGEDPTGGADHFYAPKAQAALGRPAPEWANGATPTVIGDHNFYSLSGGPSGGGQDAPASPDAPAIHRPEDLNVEALMALAGRPGESEDSPFVITADTPREVLSNLTKGTWINVDGQTRRLAGDAYVNQNGAQGDTVAAGGNAYLHEVDGMDALRAFSTAAGEQIPGLDEAAVGITAAFDPTRNFSQVRDNYRAMQAVDNQTNRGARDLGGIAGAVGTMAVPVGAGAGLLGRGGSLAMRAGKASALAVPVAGATGFLNADGGLQERATAGGVSALLGGAVAPLAVVGAEAAGALAPRLLAGGQEAGNRVRGLLGREVPEAVITPQSTNSATDYVRGLLGRSGASLDNNPVASMGKPITAAEAMGPTGTAQVTGLTRRSGRTGLEAQRILGARDAERSNRVVQDFADLTGMDPAGSADMIQNLADAGRRKAAPLYEAAYAAQVQPSSVIDGILQRPVGQAALRRAYRIARNEGRNPEDIGLFVSNRNDGLRTGASRATSDADLNADLDALRAGKKTVGAGRGPSLIDFISRNGGVRDEGGELAQIGASSWNRQGSWRNQAVKESGTDLETMAQKALDAGYFDDIGDVAGDVGNYQRLGAQDLINAIDDELRGSPRFARLEGDTDRSAAAVLRRDRRNALEERLGREGVDLSKVDNKEVSRLLRESDDAEARNMAFLEGDAPGEPMIDLIPGETPSMQTLDYVKRGLDDVVDGYRDSTTRRLNLNEEGRSVLNTVTQFREELVRMTGGDAGPYAQALSAGGDPIRLEQAFGQANRLFQVGTSQRAFNTAIERMGEADRNALVAGFADKLFRDAQAGKLTTRQLNQINVPVTREKLATLLGPERADDFMQRITSEVDLAKTGGRMAYGSNSTTAEAMQAMREQDGGDTIGGLLANNMRGGDVKRGLLSTVGDVVGAPIGGFVRGMQSPQPAAVRDEIGRLLLLSPEELNRVLSASQGGLLKPKTSGTTGVLSGLLASQLAG